MRKGLKRPGLLRTNDDQKDTRVGDTWRGLDLTSRFPIPLSPLALAAPSSLRLSAIV